LVDRVLSLTAEALSLVAAYEARKILPAKSTRVRLTISGIKSSSLHGEALANDELDGARR
jgi:hypothetical protein